MKVQKRKVNVKRHTLGYLVGNKWRTRTQAWELARRGKIDGVIACRGNFGKYIQSAPSSTVRLCDLPEVVDIR